MKDSCILCDFDGTITDKDGLYGFFTKYAKTDWLEIERLWEENKINSKECLIQEFSCIPDLNEELIEKYVKTVSVDKYFKDFYELITGKGIDFYIVSDGADYFINKILDNTGIKEIKIISNHFEFVEGKFKMTFPNDNLQCKKNAGTCKCAVVSKMKEKYKEVIYIGDGTSDYCVCDKADKLFAKGKLVNYCKENNIKYIEFKTFKEVIEIIMKDNKK